MELVEQNKPVIPQIVILERYRVVGEEPFLEYAGTQIEKDHDLNAGGVPQDPGQLQTAKFLFRAVRTI